MGLGQVDRWLTGVGGWVSEPQILVDVIWERSLMPKRGTELALGGELAKSQWSAEI